ncbi:MAG: LeoA/HP0731 family dynamin-like GTPase [Cyanobacteria bacterium J06621_8]
MNQHQFNAAAIGEQFQTACDRLNRLLSQNQDDKLLDIKQKFQRNLATYKQDGVLRVAFIGQYSAGKSTIISALTGNRDIKINADIATDKTTSYDWNGIKIIDTPGLFTDRQDHDVITYDALNKSDLLVFCLTYMLFDSTTVENFKKLAYEKKYRWKMMLVVNKMSDEAGEEAEKIANYRQSLAEALKPYSLDEFPVCFIDAKDYCDGVDEADDFLCEISRFATFTQELNNFVFSRGSLAKFDTPVRIALSAVNEAQVNLTRNSGEDSTYFEILNRLDRKVNQQRDRQKTKVESIALQMSSNIAREGSMLARKVGSNEDFAQLNQQAEFNIQKCYEQAGAEIQTVLNTVAKNIQQDFAEVLQGDLVKHFVASLDRKQNIAAQNLNADLDLANLKIQISNLKQIGEQFGINIQQLAVTGAINPTSKGFFYSATNVAGSNLHQAVYGVGKFLGFKFKPWGAVNLAKNIGNIAKCIGPALTVVGFAVDVADMIKQREREQQMTEARLNITSQYQALGKDLSSQLGIQVGEFNHQFYGDIEQQIRSARQQQENAIVTTDIWMKELLEVRKSFNQILVQISSVENNNEEHLGNF